MLRTSPGNWWLNTAAMVVVAGLWFNSLSVQVLEYLDKYKDVSGAIARDSNVHR